MKIRSITYNGIDPNFPIVVYFDRNGIEKSVDLSTIQATGNITQKIGKIKLAIQNALDDVTPLSNLPADDPYVISDPGRIYEFWDDKGNIIVRTTEITDLQIDASGRFVATFTTLK